MGVLFVYISFVYWKIKAYQNITPVKNSGLHDIPLHYHVNTCPIAAGPLGYAVHAK